MDDSSTRKIAQGGGFIEAEIISQFGSSEDFYGHFYAVSRLTWEGHEFLDNLENDTLDCTCGGERVSISASVLDSLLSAAAKRFVGIE
jgi:Hypothetical protein (DUF2513)